MRARERQRERERGWILEFRIQSYSARLTWTTTLRTPALGHAARGALPFLFTTAFVFHAPETRRNYSLHPHTANYTIHRSATCHFTRDSFLRIQLPCARSIGGRSACPFDTERECVSSIVYASLQRLNVALISRAINIGDGRKTSKDFFIFYLFLLQNLTICLPIEASNVHRMILVSQML